MQRTAAYASLILLVVLFLAFNMVSDRLFRQARIDLTDQGLYTLSQGTRNILRNIEEPVTLTLFFSEDAAAGQPALQSYGKRVTELLEEFSLIAGDRLRLERVNPEPFSEGEERAQLAGISGLAMPGSGERFYFGLLGVNSTDGRETVPFFDPREERFLEYTLAKMVYTLDNPERKKVSVISSLPIDGGQPMMPNQRPPAPWRIMAELRAMFEVETLDPGVDAIPEDTDALLIVHPKMLGAPTLRAIDDFIIGGGSTIVFVDPVAEADIPPGAAQNPLAAMQADRSSNLAQLFDAYGLRVDPAQVAADRTLAMQGRTREGGVVSYVQYMAPTADQVSTEDPVTGSIGRMQFAIAGSVTQTVDATTEFTPLVRTSEESMLLDAQQVSFFPDQAALLANFVSRAEPLTLAARITGRASSAFSDAESDENAGETGPPTPDDQPEARTGEINLIVVSDVDMLSDPMWVSEINFGGQVLGYQQLSDNGAFLLNAVDNMTGSGDLISVRARGTFSRPFTLVEEIRAQAEREYLSEQQALEASRREAEQRIAELQQARPDQGGLILTPEQQAEIESFREQLVETNRQLREVNFNLRKDVEDLGLRLKIMNIGGAPAVVLLVALGLSAARATRRRMHKANARAA